MIALPGPEALALAVLGLAMALTDARRHRVPNWVPLGLLALFLLSALALYPVERTLIAAATGAAVLALGFGLFWLGLVNGGDAKALAAASLLVAPGDWLLVATGFWLMTLFLVLVSLAARTPLGARFPLGLPVGLTLVGYALA